METKDHLLLATTLAKGLSLDRKRKWAFIMGNLIPDINPFSYLSLSCRNKFDGHSYEYRKKFIEHSLNSSHGDGFIDWYRVGNAVHYLADSFTRPHNGAFKYRLKDHVSYEHSLHQKFRQHVTELRTLEMEIGEIGSPNWCEEQHTRYMQESKGCVEDCQYILQVTSKFCSHLTCPQQKRPST